MEIANENGHFFTIPVGALTKLIWGQLVLTVLQLSGVLVVRLELIVMNVDVVVFVANSFALQLKFITLLNLGVILFLHFLNCLLQLGNHNVGHHILKL